MKKLLSTLLSIVLLFSIVWTSSAVSAATALDPNKANLSFVYLGNGTRPESEAKDFPTTPPAAGEKIWIGVQFSNMSKLRELFNSEVKDATSGLNNMTLGVLYDSTLLTPTTGLTDTHYKVFTAGNLPTDTVTDDILGSTTTQDLYIYEKITPSGDLGTMADAEPNNIQGTVKSSSLSLAVNKSASAYTGGGATASRIFQDNVVPFADGLVGDDPVIYGFFCFTVNSGVTIQPGQTVLQAGLGQNIFTIGVGSTGSSTDGSGGNALAWNQNATTDKDTNLKNYFNITDKDGNPTDPVIDLWPIYYDVDFYKTKADADGEVAGNKVGDTLTIKKGDSISTTTDAAIPDSSLFTVASDPSQVLTGLKYDHPTNGATDFTADTPITEDMLADGETTLKVYGAYETGWKVTFYDDVNKTNTLHEVYSGKTTTAALGANMPKAPDAPSDGSKVFDGWYTIVGDTLFEKDTLVEKDIEVYAKWTDKILVNFYPNNDTNAPYTGLAETIYATPNVPYDGATPVAPTRAGYTFEGWNTESNGSGTALNADVTLTTDNKTKYTFTSDDRDAYAVWEPDGTKDTGILYFNKELDAAILTPDDKITVNQGDWVYANSAPTVTEPTDYQFDGWYASTSISDTTELLPDGPGVQVNAATENVYGHWTYKGANRITINFVDGDNPSYATTTVAPGFSFSKETLPTSPSKADHSFTAWNTQAGGGGETLTTGTAINESYPDIVANGDGTYTLTFYAQYTKDITITFDVNGGSPAVTDVLKGAPSTVYEAPATVPTHPTADYAFMGWNTKNNGGGLTPVSGTTTYEAIAQAAKAADGTVPTEVTLYAYWGYVDNPEGPVKHSDTVVITFHDNAPSGITATTAPSVVYAKLGGKVSDVGTNAMPTKPTRTGYTFDIWHTKADAIGGVEFTNETVLSADIVSGDAASGYTLDVYAQWTVNSDQNQAKVTFMDNKDGKGGAEHKSYTIKSGDSLGFEVTAPANDTATFVGWYTDTADGDGVLTLTTPFTKDTAVSADTVVYAKWELILKIEAITPEAPYVYDGLAKDPIFTVYKVTKDAEGKDVETPLLEKKKASELAGHFTFTYAVGGSTKSLIDAETYSFAATLVSTSAYAAQGGVISAQEGTITIDPASLIVKLDPAEQTQRYGKITISELTVQDNLSEIVKTGTLPDAEDVYKVSFRLWTDGAGANTDVIDVVDGGVNELGTAATALPTDRGRYVIEVESINSNFTLETVKAITEGETVGVYTADEYPSYDPTATVGGNIKYTVLASDPSFANVTVQSSDNKDAEGTAITPAVTETLKLKDKDYVDIDIDGKNFDGGEDPDIDEYWIRVNDTDADDVIFTITPTNKNTGTVSSSVGKVTGPDADGKYTVTVPLKDANGDPVTQVVITTKTGDTTEDTKIEYTFNIQQLVEAKMVLNFGNSPYGEIMNDGAIENKTAAKKAFDESDLVHGNLTYGTGYIPALGITNVKYTTVAWDSYEKNYDKDETAIFVYEAQNFVDPGVKIYNQLGEEVVGATYDRSLIVKKMGVGEPNYSATLEDLDLSIASGTNSSVFTMTGNIVRPDRYFMYYTYKYTDLNGVQQTLKATRAVIVLSERGDIQLTTDPSFNGNDGTSFAVSYTKWGLPGTNSLFSYRVCDMQETTDATINGNDYTDLLASLGKYGTTPYNQYYRPLPTN